MDIEGCLIVCGCTKLPAKTCGDNCQRERRLPVGMQKATAEPLRGIISEYVQDGTLRKMHGL